MATSSSRWLIGCVVLCATLTLVVAAAPIERSTPSPSASRVSGYGVATILDGSAPSAEAGDPEQRTELVRELLQRRARALLERDRDAFLATVDPSAAELRARQAAFFDALAEVPLGTWRYRLDPSYQTALPPGVAASYGGPVWAPRVDLQFALAGFDAVPTVQEREYVFVKHDGHWYLADDGLGPRTDQLGEGTVRNLWDFGPVRVLRGHSVLVLGHPGSEARMRTVLQVAEAAIPDIAQVWRDWERRAVILVPKTESELSQLVEEPGDLSGIAAFTSSDLSRGGAPAGKRIVINPTAFGALTPSGQRIVLRHELTHVATREATTVGTPPWLAEGFADYVAYRHSGIPPHRAARELARDVRSGRIPDQLPDAADFRAGSPRLAQAYQESWLACRMIVERAGEAALVRLYQRLSRANGDPWATFDVALRDELGLTATEFVAEWQDYLREHLDEG